MLTRLYLADFEAIARLLEYSFPPTERRTKEDQRALFDTEASYRVYGIPNEQGAGINGLLAVWELDEIIFLEHFAVDPALRGQGLGSRMLQELVHMTNKPVCLEVEPPETEIARRRIAFYQRNGFFLNEYPYVQPALANGQPPIPLLLMTHGRALTAAEFTKIRDLLYREVYHVAL